MIEQYYKKPETWDRIRASWLCEPIERYVTWHHEQGYARHRIIHAVPVLMQFAEHARNQGAKSWAELPRHVASFVDRWFHGHRQNHRNERARQHAISAVRGPIEQMLRLVLSDFVGSRRPLKPCPFRQQAPGFNGYLKEERGVTANTIKIYNINLRGFETYLRRIGISALADLSPSVLSAFITERGERLGKNGMIGLCASLRVFLRYVHRERLHGRDLSAIVQAAKRYRLSTIPRSIPWADVERVLASVDRRSSNGKRDYAILLLMVTYGLRSREIGALTLEDLDWQQERLRVPERKAGHSTAYPLSPIVGEAIVDYLKHGRPKTEDRHVFMRALAPYRPCGSSCGSNRAGHYLRKVGIAVTRGGSHTLRHSCVQRLVDAQFTLKTIGDYVGHASPDTTVIYTKVNVDALRELAMGQGEEVL